MSSAPSQGTERVRAAEVIGALCLATDLGMGFPFEHGLQSTLIGMRLADRLDVDTETASQVYYACLLSHAGCTADAHVTAGIFGGSLTTHFNPVAYGSGRQVAGGLLRALPDPGSPAVVRALQTARRLPKALRAQRPQFRSVCEVARMLAGRMSVPQAVQEHLDYLLERWDGKGPLGRAKGDGIPLPMRIVHVAMDAAYQRVLGGDDHAARVIAERAGAGLDPDVARCCVDAADEVLRFDEREPVWDQALACEPAPWLMLEDGAIDEALGAMGRFADLVCPDFTGHSDGVADLAAAAAARCRIDARTTIAVRRAALVHELGRVAALPAIWQKRGTLTADEWEQVRLHPYHTERVLSASPFLAALAPVASAHHERLDGSGYHRGSTATALPVSARLLAAADAFHAMCQPRPHRDRLTAERAAQTLAAEAAAGRLDPDAVTAVIEAAGQVAPEVERPGGLTVREAEVVGLLARGLQTKQVAGELGITAKTADRHIQNAYGKIGVSTRAGATLFAMEHGLVAWGELRMAQPPART